MNIQVQLLSEDAIIPTQGTPDSAGYDLYAIEDYLLQPGERHLFKTNVAIKIPEGYYGRIAPRSGLAYKQGIDVMAGVIDSDYILDIGVILVNLKKEWESQGRESILIGVPVKISKGDRIAQIIIEKCHKVSFEPVENLNETKRIGGFGSTDLVKTENNLVKL
jgi:dUTP pyrophosphatase